MALAVPSRSAQEARRRSFALTNLIRPSRIFFASLVAATIYLGYQRWGIPIQMHTEMLLAQRAALAVEQSKDEVVFEVGTDRVAAMLKLSGYRGMWTRTGESRAFLSTKLEAAVTEFDQSVKALELHDRYRSGEVESKFRRGSCIELEVDSMPVLFCRRKVAGGEASMVVVRAHIAEDGVALTLGAFAVHPGTLTTRPVEQEGSCTFQPFLVAEREPGVFKRRWLRLFAGVPDPIDESRFTIDYERGDGRGTIEGRLIDQQTIALRVMNGPALHDNLPEQPAPTVADSAPPAPPP